MLEQMLEITEQMLEIIKIHYDPECSKSNIDMPVIAIVYRILVGLTQHSKS